MSVEIGMEKVATSRRMLNSIGLASTEDEEPTKTYIDLWPIQMSAESPAPGGNEDTARKSTLTTNFDTYTLILQLGCILHTVPSWKRTYKLRVAVFVEYESDVEEERERVTMLLKSLRIEADVLVFWLASGNLEMYEVVVNGKQGSDFDQAAEDVDDALEDEEWWAEVKKLRKPEEMSASTQLTQASDLLQAVTNWPTSSFQHGRRESKPKRFAELKKLLKRRRRKMSVGRSDDAVATENTKVKRPPKDIFSDSELSSTDGSDDEEDAIATDSDMGTSGNDVDEYDLDASDDDIDGSLPPVRRTKSASATSGISFLSNRLNLRRALWRSSVQSEERPTSASVSPLKPHPNATASDTAIPQNSKTKALGMVGSPQSQLSSSSQTQAFRPPHVRHQSLPKFTSNPQPRASIATEDTAGPSITFVDTPSPSAAKKKDPISTSPIAPSDLAALASTPTHRTAPSPLATAPTTSPSTPTASPSTTTPHPQATGYPLHSTIPLSFNDLPCRAQHLILNELIRQNSDDTAVVFTTLPSPREGTGESETESVKFISDLEVLCQGLPPCLLVHSNSMTVTMNL